MPAARGAGGTSLKTHTEAANSRPLAGAACVIHGVVISSSKVYRSRGLCMFGVYSSSTAEKVAAVLSRLGILAEEAIQ